MAVKLIQITPNPEENIAYIAKVSNPKGQTSKNFAGLLKYCVEHQHWSVFEHAYMTLEVNTSLAIATQILRHRSFTFQHFSQRYAPVNLLSDEIPLPELRRQDLKNRQNSIDDVDDDTKKNLLEKIRTHFDCASTLYNELLDAGVAKECARMVLPQATQTRLYVTGNCRSWIHYIKLRTANGTQKEHADIANECKTVFIEQFPEISKALGWTASEDVGQV